MSCCQEMRQDQQTWLKYLGDKKSWKVKGLVSSPCQAHWTHINSSFERAMLRCCDCNSLQPFHPLRLHQHLIEERGRVQLSHASLRCSTRTCAPMNKKTFLLVWYSFCLPSVFLGRHFRWYSILLDSWVRILATHVWNVEQLRERLYNKNCRPPPPPPPTTTSDKQGQATTNNDKQRHTRNNHSLVPCPSMFLLLQTKTGDSGPEYCSVPPKKLPTTFVQEAVYKSAIRLSTTAPAPVTATTTTPTATTTTSTATATTTTPTSTTTTTTATTTHYYYHDCYYFLQLKIHDFKGYHRFIRKAWNNTNCEIATASVSATWV